MPFYPHKAREVSLNKSEAKSDSERKCPGRLTDAVTPLPF